ncbi:periplasmic chaperone for outer membrane proteins Skp [Gilliamella bombicola]|uniref:Periplasmic chaperone for outer membrane proteins Skp n=1 Tax=Gilliamella bombicola TaxID=1798182 RepID=A0A1C4BY56_9GAMM|nr:OmpH family outer membrane protein [Gilliamella bombicola]MWN05062.1 molecular chaperone [Gilliamella sp. Pas-s95]NUF28101.1 molecular chaperone [Gilliamella sp. ESL0254]SCC11821.1 periplasmic chaperone for outer membrane proteins Skp [Gilliamella bombicola]
MKKIIAVLGISAALLFAGFANAEVKLGVINVESVLERMPQRESVRKMLKNEFEARANSLQEEEKKSKEAIARLKKDGLTLSSSEKAKLNKVISDFESKADAFSVDYQKRQKEEAEKLFTKIQEAVKDIVATEGYDVILSAGATLFASDAVDISDKVLEKVKN